MAKTLLTNLIERSYLRKLSLVEANLNEETMPVLCEFIQTNRCIEAIDISWNKMRPRAFEQFLELLRDNRKLKFINISWNQLVEITKPHWTEHADIATLINEYQDMVVKMLSTKKRPFPLERLKEEKLTDDELQNLSAEEREKVLLEEE